MCACGERGGILLGLHGVRVCAEKETIFFQMTGRYQRASHFVSRRWLRLLNTDNTGVLTIDALNSLSVPTLAARGLEELFSSCAVVSVFWLWWEIVLGVTYLPYKLCRCVFFLLRREIVLGCTDQFFGCGGK